MTKIKVTDFYSEASYYSVMPREIFDTLEQASIDGEDYTDVETELFNQMIMAHKNKKSANTTKG